MTRSGACEVPVSVDDSATGVDGQDIPSLSATVADKGESPTPGWISAPWPEPRGKLAAGA